jgi:hypothetical protein
MSECGKILNDMDKILDLLIENADELLIMAKQGTGEEELTKLQELQEVLLNQLIEQDDLFYESDEASSTRHIPLRSKIDQKLEEFQGLNTLFIENITSMHD